MKLATFSPDPLDKQYQLVLSAFGQLQPGPQCSPDPQRFDTPKAWPPASLGQWVHIAGTATDSSLEVRWPIPEQTPNYKEHPAAYITHILGYSGVKSMRQTLL